ncbi:MAG: hypothetical protein WC765_09630 [Phycisphaerae bacterium]|jgi:hypothetical protein
MKNKKENQRFIDINTQSFSSEISKFLNKEYEFASEQSSNDMWLKIDFKKNITFEKSVLDFIHCILMENYAPFKKIKPETHC